MDRIKRKSNFYRNWRDAFTAIDNSANPYYRYVFVDKQDVHGIPSNFSLSTNWAITKLYRQNTSKDTFTIRDCGPIYLVGKEKHHPDHYPDQHDSSDLPRAAVMAGVGTIGAIAAGKALGELFSSENTSPPSRSPSQLAYAAQKLDDKQYNVFVSHSWEHETHYQRIVEFLNSVPSITWQNHSVPSTDPLAVETDQALEDELYNQIRSASVVIVSAGMYGSYSKWISRELDIANDLNKPVIAIIPEGQVRVPAKIQNSATEQIGWRRAPLIRALAQHG